MRNVLKAIYHFLPVQLLLLHFRKYQFLLVFWLIVVGTVTGHFAAHFGASSLFLAPEYLGKINFASMFLLGGAMAVFVMGWHITTFIIHGHRIPYMGAANQTFLVYCVNNSAIPFSFFVFYSIFTIHFQLYDEHTTLEQTLLMQLGFYLGVLIITLISFAYFFRMGKDMLKVILSKITNPARIREIIPYDTLDYDLDILRVDSYIGENLHVCKCSELERYHPRVLNTILRRHHRNAITATIFSFVFLLVIGIFMDEPLLRIPAGASFLMLFAILMGIVGAVKYFLRSWETIGWIFIWLFISWMVFHRLFDLRSVAYGPNYKQADSVQPVYEYYNLKRVFSPERYQQDKRTEAQRLDNWKNNAFTPAGKKPPLVVITVSGGGSRAAYWTFRTLQYIDSASGGKLSKNAVLVTGASGGMIGATYWRAIHYAALNDTLKNPYNPAYQANVGKDLLNPIVFSLTSVDLISPFNKISIAGHSYTKDRGYALEQELIRNTDGLLNKSLADYKADEALGRIPMVVVNGTIINDGRKLMMCPQPISYLTRAEYSLKDTTDPPIDAVDFCEFFARQNPYDLRITSALRMTATFPFILPVVKLPSQPTMNIMDAGLRDNFGTEVASRYLYVMRDWITQNAGNVIFLEIRDTRESELSPAHDEYTLSSMLSDPLFVIQEKWETFQSYYHTYLKDYAPYCLNGNMRFVTLQYVPRELKKTAALNFHLTQREEQDLYQSINYTQNQIAIDTLLKLLGQ